LQNKLQSLSAEQRSAVEALTRGLMNKYLHQTVQAMKLAAKEGDAATVKTICDMYEIDPSAAEVVRGNAARPSAPSAIDLERQDGTEADAELKVGL
jgi:glutamyl-tRNA reductase